jgi:nucleoid-associated protein YgaU
MRIVLGVLLLLVGFVAAVWLRQAFTSAAREESERSFGEAELDLAPIPEGWGRAIVGSKSGVPPLPEDEARALPAFKKTEPEPAPKSESKSAAQGNTAQGTTAQGTTAQGTGTAAKDPARPTTPPTATTKPRTHTVVAGETLGRICAAAYGTSDKSLVAAVARANNLPSPDAIKVGQVLRLPPREDLR